MFEIKPMEYIISKTCRICNIEKPIDNFYKTKKNTDGYFNSCKECDKEKSKQWALNNPNKIKERKQTNKYKEAHRLRSAGQRCNECKQIYLPRYQCTIQLWPKSKSRINQSTKHPNYQRLLLHPMVMPV